MIIKRLKIQSKRICTSVWLWFWYSHRSIQRTRCYSVKKILCAFCFRREWFFLVVGERLWFCETRISDFLFCTLQLLRVRNWILCGLIWSCFLRLHSKTMVTEEEKSTFKKYKSRLKKIENFNSRKLQQKPMCVH